MLAWYSQAVETLLREHAQDALPNECAGLIGIDPFGSVSLFPTPSQSTSPAHFEIPAHLYWSIRYANAEIVGIYHSHPSGRAELSTQDLKSMLADGHPSYPGVEWLIIPCVNDSVLRPVRFAWCDQQAQFQKRS